MNTEIINEKKIYDYSCLMLNVNMQDIVEFAKNNINQEDLYNEEEDPEKFGLEPESHVTILYGLHKNVDSNDVFNVCKLFKHTNLTLDNISIFDNEKFDVLKFDILSDELFLQNKIISSMFDFTTDYPDYHAHITIAYLKKGTSDKYISMFQKFLKNKLYTCFEYVYSTSDGDKYLLNTFTNEIYNNEINNNIEENKRNTFKNMFFNVNETLLNDVYDNDLIILTPIQKSIIKKLNETKCFEGLFLNYFYNNLTPIKSYNFIIENYDNEIDVETLKNGLFDIKIVFSVDNSIKTTLKNVTLESAVNYINNIKTNI